MKPIAPPAPHDGNPDHLGHLGHLGSVPDGASAHAGAAVGAVGSADGVLEAHTLLAGRPWVGIEHNGQHYRLQTTRAGKLILTK